MKKNLLILAISLLIFFIFSSPVLALTFKYGTESASFIKISFDSPFNLFTYILISSLYIMISHFAFLSLSEFALMLMVSCFVFGGVLGIWIGYETGLIIAIILSLLFVSGPKKEML